MTLYDQDQTEATMDVLVPSLDPDRPPLTPDQIKMSLANHAMILQQISEAVHDQQRLLAAALFTLNEYMGQYPLKLIEGEGEVPQPGQYL